MSGDYVGNYMNDDVPPAPGMVRVVGRTYFCVFLVEKLWLLVVIKYETYFYEASAFMWKVLSLRNGWTLLFHFGTIVGSFLLSKGIIFYFMKYGSHWKSFCIEGANGKLLFFSGANSKPFGIFMNQWETVLNLKEPIKTVLDF